jgi:pimeloyl-ACP methyl ester carboxylesterase
MAKQLWLFPGLGTDHRVFDPLIRQLPSWIEPRAFDWLEPLSAQESLSAYAERFSAQLPKVQEPPCILGLSLGGMLASTLCLQGQAYERLLLVSSAGLRSELPWYFALLRRLPIYRLVPKVWTARFLPWAAKRAGIVQDAEHLNLFVEMLRAQSPLHFAWGRQVAVHWQNEVVLARKAQLHGSKDHIFPARRSQAQQILPGATHGLILDQAPAVAAWIAAVLANETL